MLKVLRWGRWRSTTGCPLSSLRLECRQLVYPLSRKPRCLNLLVHRNQIQRVSRPDREKTQMFFSGIAQLLKLSGLESRRIRSFVQHRGPA